MTPGTFMNGLMHVGDATYAGGRVGEGAARGISDCLAELGFRLVRLKTGTPPPRSPRLDRLRAHVTAARRRAAAALLAFHRRA